MNEAREQAMQLLRVAQREFPELRLCQIIINATGAVDPYNVTDDVLAQKLKQYINQQRKWSRERV